MLLTGLLGWPVSHSRSPAMHNAAFQAAGVDGVYLPLPVSPDRIEAAVRGLVALGFGGANVTIPHKQAVIPFLDELSPAARAIGAVNTIVVRADGSLFGDNTDAPGFLADLSAQGIRLSDLVTGGALIFGAGGSGRAIVYALATAGIPILLAARRSEQAQHLITDLLPHLPSYAQLRSLPPDPAPDFGPLLRSLAPSAPRLIVNCTSLGMTPRVDVSPWPDDVPFRRDQIVYDLVYNPPETRLLAQARACGARGLNGLGMLLHQGALAWEQWVGRPAPLAAMSVALQDFGRPLAAETTSAL